MAVSYIPFEFTSGTYRAKLRASYEDAFGSGSHKDSDAYLFSESRTVEPDNRVTYSAVRSAISHYTYTSDIHDETSYLITSIVGEIVSSSSYTFGNSNTASRYTISNWTSTYEYHDTSLARGSTVTVSDNTRTNSGSDSSYITNSKFNSTSTYSVSANSRETFIYSRTSNESTVLYDARNTTAYGYQKSIFGLVTVTSSWGLTQR